MENNPAYFTEVSETALQVLDELTHAPELKELRAPQYQTQEGLHQGIEGAVDLLREAGVEDQLIIEKIVTKFELTLAEAESYVLPGL